MIHSNLKDTVTLRFAEQLRGQLSDIIHQAKANHWSNKDVNSALIGLADYIKSYREAPAMSFAALQDILRAYHADVEYAYYYRSSNPLKYEVTDKITGQTILIGTSSYIKESPAAKASGDKRYKDIINLTKTCVEDAVKHMNSDKVGA